MLQRQKDIAMMVTDRSRRLVRRTKRRRIAENLCQVFLVFFSALTSVLSEDLPCTEHHLTIPPSCCPGQLLLSLEFVGQSFQISTTHPVSSHFAVLANGDVICAAASGQPLAGTVSFGVECRLGLLAWTELIHVTVADPEDVLVAFTQPYFEGHIVENAPSNSVVSGLQNISVFISNLQGRVLVKDNHQDVTESDGRRLNVEEIRSRTNLEVQFSIVAGPAYMFYLADNGDGSVAVRTLVELDFERQSQYLLTLVASVPAAASTASARVRVYVDNINDNAPVLDRAEYNFRLDDVTRPEAVRGMRVTAFDADDEQLTYGIDSEDGELFVDAFSGEFYFRHPPPAERRVYEVRVYADDGLHRSDPSVVTVRLDQRHQRQHDAGALTRSRRDVRPLRQVEIPENMIGDVVDIGSGGRHEYFTFREPAPRQLVLDALTGVVRVRAGERLDFETQPEINFVVIITSMDDASGISLRHC